MELLEIGRIIRPQGLKGLLRLRSYLERAETLSGVAEVLVGRSPGETEPFRLEGVQTGQGTLILALGGIADRNEAEKLTGLSVWIPADRMKPLSAGEYYWREIIGLTVVTEEGKRLGAVASVFPTGSNDVYVCRDGAQEILLPAIADVIREIDREKGLLVVRLLKGLTSS